MRFFTGQRSERHEVKNALAHLPLCGTCRALALEVVRELRRLRAFKPAHGGLGAFAGAVEEEHGRTVAHMLGRAGWIRLTSNPRISASEHVLEPAVIEAGLEELEAPGSAHPSQGEELALLLLRLIERNPHEHYSTTLANEHRVRAYCTVGNFRRLLTDWAGSEAALATARQVASGLDRPGLEAKLLSIEASLAFDTGNLEDALGRMGRASEIHQKEGNLFGLGRIAVQRGATLATAYRSEEALQEAEEAIRLLRAEDAHLELLALFVRTQALVQLGRMPEAIMSLNDSSAMVRRVGGLMPRLQRQYLEGLALDTMGNVKEAEVLLKDVIRCFLEAEMMKNALIVWFDLFESAFKRSAYEKAARLCEECLAALRDSRVHDQMREVWAGMLKLVRQRKLREYQLRGLRVYVGLHWSLPAATNPLATQKET